MTIRRGWLFAGAILIPLLFVVEAFLYYPALLDSGTLPVHADSISIPIAWTLISTPFNMLALTLYALPAAWGYRGDAGWLTAERGHPWRLAFSILLYALPGLVLLGGRVYMLSRGLALYEHAILIVIVPLLIWLLMLRAAMAAARADMPAAASAG